MKAIGATLHFLPIATFSFPITFYTIHEHHVVFCPFNPTYCTQKILYFFLHNPFLLFEQAKRNRASIFLISIKFTSDLFPHPR